MGRRSTAKAGKALTPGGGVNTAAEESAKQFGLLKTSGLRTDEDLKNNIGHPGDDHQKGTASDFAPPSNIAKTPQGIKMMDDFAQSAIKSGQYKKVIWQGKDWMSGVKVDGHYDHVHVSW